MTEITRQTIMEQMAKEIDERMMQGTPPDPSIVPVVTFNARPLVLKRSDYVKRFPVEEPNRPSLADVVSYHKKGYFSVEGFYPPPSCAIRFSLNRLILSVKAAFLRTMFTPPKLLI